MDRFDCVLTLVSLVCEEEEEEEEEEESPSPAKKIRKLQNDEEEVCKDVQ